jgi:hypothetical protein
MITLLASWTNKRGLGDGYDLRDKEHIEEAIKDRHVDRDK